MKRYVSLLCEFLTRLAVYCVQSLGDNETLLVPDIIYFSTMENQNIWQSSESG